MNERLNWMLPSFELVRLGSLRVRISIYFLPLLLVFPIRFGLTLGLVVAAILLLSVFIHELGHVCLARLTGGTASEIHLSPFGGLAMVQTGRGTLTQVVTILGGPFANLMICLAVYPRYYAPEALWGIFNPFVFPVGELREDHLLADLGLVTFTLNWILLLINLLPILPLDGGRVTRTLLVPRMHPEMVDRFAVQISMVCAALLALGGLCGDQSIIVILGALLFIMNMWQLMENESIDREEDSFLGYDFSEGYTSLDRSAPAVAPAHASDTKHGMLEQWRQRRRELRELALRKQQEDAERQLDDLLAKVHANGIDSLTLHEQQLLKQVSDLLRERGKRST